MIGADLFVVGIMILTYPFWMIWRRFGEISDETIISWIFELTLEKRFQLHATMSAAVAMVTFGLFLIVRPH